MYLERKTKVNGTIDKYKAILLVKGVKQNDGLDYFHTYLPVTRITSIWMLVALEAVYDLKFHQTDVKTTFLRGELEEEIYMEQLEGLWFMVKKEKCANL